MWYVLHFNWCQIKLLSVLVLVFYSSACGLTALYVVSLGFGIIHMKSWLHAQVCVKHFALMITVEVILLYC